MLQRNGKLLYKRFAEYFIPTILMAMALSMSIVVDGIIVGNMLGPDALAAVNLALPLTQAYAVLYSVFGVGGSVLAAFYKGKRDHGAADLIFSVSIAFLVLTAVVCTAGGLILREELVALLGGGNQALREPLERFITPLIYGCALFVVIPGAVYFVRTDGRPKLAAAVLIVANLINIGCDIVFISISGDIMAASVATVTGYCIGGSLLAAYARSKRRGLRFAVPSMDYIRQAGGVIKAGLPSGLSTTLMFLKLLCINNLVLSVAGKAGMVAFSVCISCLSLASMFIAGASQTMMPIVGVLSGEGDYAGIRFVFRRAFTILFSSSLVLVLVLELFPGGLLRIFGVTGEENLAVGMNAVRLFAPSLLGTAFTFLMLYYTQTMRRQNVAVAITVIQGFAVVVPAAWLLSQVLGLTGIWLSFSAAEAAALLAVFVMARHVSARSGGEVKGLLMLPEAGESGTVLDVTIRNSIREAVQLSETVTRFCRDNGMEESRALRVGLAVEEMAVNTAKHGGNAPGTSHIDIAVSVGRDETRVSFRDDGNPFDPLDYGAPDAEGPAFTGIAVIRKMAERMEYTYALGFNNIVIAVKNI